MTKKNTIRTLAMTAAIAVLALPVTAAVAAQAEPAVSSSAWYWKSQSSQAVTDPTSGADVAVIEAPNPFCPGTPGLGSVPEPGCKSGRLPIEVRNGDYEEPEMVSAVGFDLSLVPFGSEVKKFTVTFLEANDAQSAPANAEGKSLQACFVTDFFGDGEAREYKERPSFECAETDPQAKRKATMVKNEDGEEEERFEFTFDLTPFAETWIGEGTPVTAILLYPVKPGEEDFNGATDNNFRTVLTGPAEPEGVKTSLSFTPAEIEGFPAPPPAAPIDDGFDDGGSSFDSGTSDFGSPASSSGDLGSGTAPGGEVSGDAPAEAAPPIDTPDALAASDELDPTAGGLPGYVYLALLAGLIGFSLVRSTVVEAATGIRPDGVLSQIRRLNIDRRGAPIEATTTATGGRWDPLKDGFKQLGTNATGLIHKLPFKRKG